MAERHISLKATSDRRSGDNCRVITFYGSIISPTPIICLSRVREYVRTYAHARAQYAKWELFRFELYCSLGCNINSVHKGSSCTLFFHLLDSVYSGSTR